MTNIKDILQKLCEYFDPNVTFDEIVEKDEQNALDNLPIITNAMKHTELSNVFLELCSEYRMGSQTQSDVIAVHVETWNEFSKFINPDQFSVFFYALIANGKSNLHPKCKTIAMLSARCYCLCQTSPGSKVRIHCFKQKCFLIRNGIAGIRFLQRSYSGEMFWYVENAGYQSNDNHIKDERTLRATDSLYEFSRRHRNFARDCQS